MKITIVTNEYPDGWNPKDFHTGMLGGSEEAIILFAEELVRRDHEVTIYHTKKEGELSEIYNGVQYKDSRYFIYDYDSTLISFQSLDRLSHIPHGTDTIIHWSCEVEKYKPLGNVDYFVNLSDFHRSRHFFVPAEKSKVIPLGIDKALLDQNKVEREEDTMLYCSSPDRGLAVLLDQWPQIKKHHPTLKLRIAYGFTHIRSVEYRNKNITRFIKKLFELMDQEDVEYLGALSKEDISKEYWRNKYWCLPLYNAESELFCLNAIKSKYCGAIPVVNKIGALKNTVGEYISYKNFIDGSLEKSDVGSVPVPALTWSEVIDTYWSKLLTNS